MSLYPAAVRVDLGYLTPRYVRVGPEVGEVGRSARLARLAARIPAHQASIGQSPDEVVEGRAWYDVFILLSPGRVYEACRVGSYLGELASGDVVAWAEVGVVGRVARFAWATARVAVDDAPACHAVYIGVEGASGWHVLKGDRAGCRVKSVREEAGGGRAFMGDGGGEKGVDVGEG